MFRPLSPPPLLSRSRSLSRLEHHHHRHRSLSRQSSRSAHSRHSHSRHSHSRSRSRSRSRPNSRFCSPSCSRSRSRSRPSSRSRSRPSSRSRSRPRSRSHSNSHSHHHHYHPRSRLRSVSPVRFHRSTRSFLDSPPDSLSGTSSFSHLPMRRSTSLSSMRHRDLDFFDDPLVFRNHQPSFRSVSVTRADSIDGARSSRNRRNRRRSRPRRSYHSEERPRRLSNERRDSYSQPTVLFPAPSPGPVFNTAKHFIVLIGNISAGTPWMQVTDELTGRCLILGSGSTLTPSGEAVLTNEVSEQLVTLSRVDDRDRRGGEGVVVVTQNKHGEPLMTALMPSVSDPRRRQRENPSFTYDNNMGRTQGHPFGYGPQMWNGGGNFPTGQVPDYTGAYGLYGYPWQQGTLAAPFSNTSSYQGVGYGHSAADGNADYSGRRSSSGDNVEGMVAAFYPGKGYRRGSGQKRKRSLFKLMRSSDGMSEWLQDGDGRKLAGIKYKVAGPAGFAAQGGASRLYVRAGVDVTMVAASLASRIWIWAETGVTH